MKQVLLRDFVNMDFVVDSKKLVATLETLHIKRERTQLIGFDGTIIGGNHLSRKNLPWQNSSGWKTTEELVTSVIKRYCTIRSRKDSVFAACWLIGDQSSVKTIRCLAEHINQIHLEDVICAKQEKLLRENNVSDDDIVEMMDMVWSSLQDLFEWRKVKTFCMWKQLSDKLWVTYGLAVQYRLEWRKQISPDKNNDCRTYRGQPDRDMVCV